MSEDSDKKLNPWHPITNPVDLKTLGKLAEECGELVAATNRCIIQGVEEEEPVTGVVNRHWLENEIADVYANTTLVIQRFGLDISRIAKRAEEKSKRLREWHKMA